MSDVRTRRLLPPVAWSSRNGSCPGHQAFSHSKPRARRGLGLLLRRRSLHGAGAKPIAEEFGRREMTGMTSGMTSPRNKALAPFAALIGRWRMSATHPMLPGEQFRGAATLEWLDDGAFVLWRSSIEDSRFPVGVAILGSDDERGEYFML